MNLIPYISNRTARNSAHDIADLLGWSAAAPFSRDDGMRFHEDKDNYFVSLDLPGIRKEDLEIEAQDQVLTVTAHRKVGFGEAKETFTVRRSLSLPEDVDAEKINAALADGVLSLTLPKREETKPKQLKIAVN